MTTEDDCTCAWRYGKRQDDPACPYHHRPKPDLTQFSISTPIWLED